jgi:outer membrane protein OmpA-like peptidoglycan-associated protein
MVTVSLAAQESNCKNTVHGKVVNKKTGEIMSHTFVQLKLNNQIVKEVFSAADGSFDFSLDCDQRYIVSAINENFTKNIKLVYTDRQPSNHELTLELIPLPEFKTKDNQQYIITESIVFEPDSFDIDEYTAETLDFVYQVMDKYHYMSIEIGFHSNNLGDLDFLKGLTQKRADVCKDYLVNKGIDSTRITAVGYGFTQPIEECNTEAMRSGAQRCTKNYRTEFKVTSEAFE